jgi:hypothetical protein
VDDDRRGVPGSETAKTRDTTTFANGFLKAPPDGHEVMEKTKGIEEIGFPRGVRTYKEDPAFKIRVNCDKISPIL